VLTLLGNGITTATPGQLALSAGLAVLFAALGYRMSARHRALRGVTPWRLPSFAWAVLCLVLQFVGIAIEVLAELTTRSPYSPAAPAPSAAPSRQDPARRFAPPTTSPVAVEPPAPGELPGVLPPGHPVDVLAEQPGRLAPPLDEAGRPALFGWYGDPTGRHERRYFDGRCWSEHVLDGDALGVDRL
jgi:hypothetical protein